MTKQMYPSWRYSKSGTSKIVHSAEEDITLGPDWADSSGHWTKLEQVQETVIKPIENENAKPDVVTLPDNVIPLKRGRGRPKKN